MSALTVLKFNTELLPCFGEENLYVLKPMGNSRNDPNMILKKFLLSKGEGVEI